MKKIFFLLSAVICINVSAQEFKFTKEVIDYGTVAKGSDGKRVFEFKNVGDAPLIIERISSPCGCTVPKKPEKPIMPGEIGKIEVSYDTKRLGGFSKSLSVFSNAKKGRKVIKIKGRVTGQIMPVKERSMLSNSM